MDRRQQKTRTAIYRAFTTLLDRQNFHSITVQDIIDEANIGRSTFYAHFETKEELVKSLCRELFDHIIGTAMDKQDTHGLYACTNAPHSVICHILQHLQENDNNILILLSCESSPIFMSYFKSGMEELVRSQLLGDTALPGVPREFLVNHIAGSFVEMVQWWLDGGRKETPQTLDGYFRAVMEPLLTGGNHEHSDSQ